MRSVVTSLGLLACMLVFGCDDPPAPVVIDGDKAARDVQAELKKLGDTEAARDLSEGAQHVGRGIEEGARGAVVETGRAIQGAGRALEESALVTDAGVPLDAGAPFDAGGPFDAGFARDAAR